jgi:ABC-type multidrug transport system fused ATPase/permease subunit
LLNGPREYRGDLALKILGIIRTSMSLLSKRDQRVLLVVVVIQFLVSLLDLIGVLLLGVVAALIAAATTGTPITNGGLSTILDWLPSSTSFVIGLAFVAAIVLVVKSVLALLLTRKTFRFLANRQAMVAGSIAQRLLTRPLLEVQARSSQEISVALTAGVSALTLTVLGQGVVIAAEISLVSALFVGLIFVDPLVAGFTVLFFGSLVAILQFLLGSWATSLGNQSATAEIGSFAAVQHALRAYREITVTGRRSLFIAKFQALRWDAAKVQSDQFILSQIGKYVFEIGLIVGAGLLVLLMSLTKDPTAGIAIITVFLAASSRVFPSLLRMQAGLSGIRGAQGTASVTLGLLADLNTAEKVYSPPTIPPALAAEFNRSVHEGFPGFDGTVSVSSVSLGYPGASELALDSVTIDIPRSQSVALVGSTGAGKSTLADVILGVLLPDSGSVLISGFQPFESVHRWPGAMAYVPQDVAVLTGSVRENVALGIPSDFIDNSLVWEALESAHLAEFLRSSRDGIETLVGENGVQLSGGQRQRLGIARALYSRPKLIVLDEATSALDAETERIITDALDSLSGDVTLIVIAHRLATVRHCDQVIHLSEGKITGRGTFEEVRAQVPDFNRQAELLGL